jgi:hypothetical protein
MLENEGKEALAEFIGTYPQNPKILLAVMRNQGSTPEIMKWSFKILSYLSNIGI